MMNSPSHLISQAGRSRWSRGFTLVEIMISMALLSVIILGLVAMFNQTRRAFTSSLTQVDVLESGRAVADLVARDLEQMAPSYYKVPNFYVFNSGFYSQVTNQLADPNDVWTNVIQELYFLKHNNQPNQQWSAVGYRLSNPDETAGLGTLYRYEVLTNNNGNIDSTLDFKSPTLVTNFNRIIDGVTHFSVRSYTTNGILITNAALFPNASASGTIVMGRSINRGQDYQYVFYSNAVPAYVEIELGILETRTLERYRALPPNGPVAFNFLVNHPGQVHLFRQRIPIRAVDPTAFQ